MRRVAIVGGGPAGLMAAERLVAVDGLEVAIFDAMPSFGRKFLMAGKGGMNITHSEPLVDFVGRYGERQAEFSPFLERFGPQQLREWLAGLGIASFVGSSGRVFPGEIRRRRCCAPGCTACARRACGSIRGIAGPDGTTTARCASTPPPAA